MLNYLIVEFFYCHPEQIQFIIFVTINLVFREQIHIQCKVFLSIPFKSNESNTASLIYSPPYFSLSYISLSFLHGIMKMHSVLNSQGIGEIK